jgi:hypothetical protein
VVLAGLFPWAMRNHRVIGEWRWLTTRGGVSLYDGVQPGTHGQSDLAHTKSMPEIRELSETQWDRYFSEVAWKQIREEPGRVFKLMVIKFTRMWSLRPNEMQYRSGNSARISLAWMAFLLASGAYGLWLHRRRPAAILVLLWPVIVTTGVHMLFVASVRYRVPIMPMIMVLSAAGLTGLMSPRGRDPSRPMETVDGRSR